MRRRLADADPAVRRVAAEAIGRLGSVAAIPELLAQMRYAQGRVLEHSLVYALIEIGDAPALESAWAQADPAAQRAILLALDQMPAAAVAARLGLEQSRLERRSPAPNGNVDCGAAPRLGHRAGRLCRAAVAGFGSATGSCQCRSSVSWRPFWAMPMCSQRLRSAWKTSPTMRRNVACCCNASSSIPANGSRLPCKRPYHGSSRRPVRNGWPRRSWPSVLTHGRSAMPQLVAQLRGVAERDDFSSKLRLQAIGALRGNPDALPESLFQLALDTAVREEEFELRRLATEALSGAKLTPEQLTSLVGRAAASRTCGAGTVDPGVQTEPPTRRSPIVRCSASARAIHWWWCPIRCSARPLITSVPARNKPSSKLLQARLAGQADQAERLQRIAGSLAERRYSPWAAGVSQQQGGMLHVSCHGLSRWRHWSRLNTYRPHSITPRSARGDRVSQPQFCTQLRTVVGHDEVRDHRTGGGQGREQSAAAVGQRPTQVRGNRTRWISKWPSPAASR